MQRLNPNNILVVYNRGRFQGRTQTSLNFEEEYADALRHALDAVKAGCTNIEVIQYRNVLHTGEELKQAALYLTRNSTDEEVIEQCHHASRSASRSKEHKELLPFMPIRFGPGWNVLWSSAA